MTETRSARLGLVRYSSGSDSPSRLDWEETMAAIEAKVPYDDGTRVDDLPLIEYTHPARYIEQAVSDGTGNANERKGRVLWRGDADRRWQPVGGTVMPRTSTHRALEGQDAAGLAWRVSHPNLASDAVAFHWNGDSEHAGRITVYDPMTVAGRPRGVLHVGIQAAPDPAVLGRHHVRTRYEGDRAITARAHDYNAGNLLTLTDAGNQDQVEVDAAGRMLLRQGLTLGGASPVDAAALRAPLYVGPGTKADGPIGPVFHGRASRPDVDILTLQRFEPGIPADQGPGRIARFGTKSITLGRVDGSWAADSRVSRGAAALDDTGTWTLYLEPRDRSAPADARITQFDKATGLLTTNGMFVDNRADPARVVDRKVAYGTGRLAEWSRGKTGSASKVAAYLTADGQMVPNAPWRSSDTDRPVAPRDARQPVMHTTTQRWVLPGQFGLYRGPIIFPRDRTFSFDFPEMRVRSASPTNLYATMRLEMLTFAAILPFLGLDRVVMNCYLAVSINRQPFERIDAAGYEQESVGMTTSPVAYAPGDSTTWVAVYDKLVPAGSTFQWRFVIRNSDGFGPIRMRRADLHVMESIVETYAQEGPPPLGWNLTEAERSPGFIWDWIDRWF